MKYVESLKPIEPYLVGELPLLKKAYTIQVVLLRQTHDLSIFRTEATGELNIVTLPHSASDDSPELKIVMYGSKQKAPETRQYVNLVRTLAQDMGVELDEDQRDCALKDRLCMKCPRCALFGAVSLEERWNIKHRVDYNSAYSLENYEDYSEVLTWNAVETPTQSTGRALGKTETTTPLVNFPSIVTLTSVTEAELIMFLKTLLTCKSYGAETRIRGEMSNYLLGIVGGYEELLTPLELNLELNAREWRHNPEKAVKETLEAYREYAAFRTKVRIVTGEELKTLTNDLQEFEPTEEFLQEMYEQAKNLQTRIEEYERG